MQVWNMLHAARWKYSTQKIAICTPLHNFVGYIFANKARIDNRKKKLVKQQYLPTCSHNMVNFVPLAAEIGSVVWGTPANFNRFHILASLLQRHRTTEANQTLHGVWPSPGPVHYTVCPRKNCPPKYNGVVFEIFGRHHWNFYNRI